MNRQATDWEKIFSVHMSEKGVVSRNMLNFHSLVINKKII